MVYSCLNLILWIEYNDNDETYALIMLPGCVLIKQRYTVMIWDLTWLWGGKLERYSDRDAKYFIRYELNFGYLATEMLGNLKKMMSLHLKQEM